MQEKLVEHWLTNVNELTYQVPFCEVLVAMGYDVIHVSTHGRGEHGKDIVARNPKGRLQTFQLKGGDITLSEWRSIRGEVEELVQLPVRVPGISESEPHTPFLVTNGEIRGDAIESIVRYRTRWSKDGSPRLRIISRRTLLRHFLNAQGSFMPTELVEFRRFVELFVADFTDRLPREKFAGLLEELVRSMHTNTPRRTQRALAGLSIVAGYIAEQYERASNHIGAAEAWTICACVLLGEVERQSLAAELYKPVLDLVGLALDRNLRALKQEMFAKPHFGEPKFGLADSFVYGARTSITFGWLAADAHRQWQLGNHLADNAKVIRVMKREAGGIMFAGEIDWPSMLLLATYLERVMDSREGEAVLERWVRLILGANQGGQEGLPSPYWTHERVIEWTHGMLPPRDAENFAGHTYTLLSALDMLVRRMRRQYVAHCWPEASRLQQCDFKPDELSAYFQWSVDKGEVTTTISPREASWSKWREGTARIDANQIPKALLRHPEWLAPYLMTYPHRANRTMSALADALFGRRAVELLNVKSVNSSPTMHSTSVTPATDLAKRGAAKRRRSKE